ncbi:hypothetical protein E2C01_083761 [Portunus trituberculatus]|uniref:Uncharacterized protein n=1 Tax=Portunus trituberculatus TaxID=210409 RepID=A0A5B7J2I8_PORTR|nr:hypothetical protein [Portunus trituberculatus]
MGMVKALPVGERTSPHTLTVTHLGGLRCADHPGAGGAGVRGTGGAGAGCSQGGRDLGHAALKGHWMSLKANKAADNNFEGDPNTPEVYVT